MLWTGKSGLMVFWLGMLAALETVPAKPFGLLLLVLAGVLLLLHLVIVLLLDSGRTRWIDKLQLLLFGAFHLQAEMMQARVIQPVAVGAESDVQTAGRHADQDHAG